MSAPPRPLTIVDVAEFYADRGGGVKTYIHQKLRAGARAGHRIVIIAPGPEDGEEAREGGTILWVKGPPMPFDPRYYVLWNERKVHALLDRVAPDIVEGSSPWSGGWFAARWKDRRPVPAKRAFIFHQDPVAVYPHTLLDRWLEPARIDRLFGPYWGWLRALSSHYDRTIVAGQWLADRLASFGVQAPVSVPFGIDKDRFSPSLADPLVKSQWLQQCGIDDPDAPLWVAISRLHPEKRVPVLLDAFRRARQDRPMGLVLIGDGPMHRQVARDVARTPGAVHAGFLEDRTLLARTLASADGFLHGSAAETFGLVVAEAIASGLPLVVPNRGGAFELAHPSWAEVYATGDASACAAAMRRLLARDRGSLRLALARAREEVVSTMDGHFDALFATYAALVGEGRTVSR
jgi:alpha-1,6-mannosyltransferase